MAPLIYGLCAITALACAWLLLRSYRATRRRLQLWCGLCFAVMFINNLLLVVDRIIIPETDLSLLRHLAALLALLPLLYGLILEDE